ncbi:MAG: hypothetical protein IJS45_11770 [Clostridia bacterium]|nr:hypothetical protein [Clostridia bacterium]
MKNGKKVFAIWAAVFAVVAAAAVFVGIILPRTADNNSGSANEAEYNNLYDWFYDAKWVPLEEREDYEDYLDLNRFLYFKDGNVTRGISDDNEQQFDEDTLFFKKYFAALEAGDASAYDALFSDAYIAEHGKTPEFTPQMTYDRTVERVSVDYFGGTSSYTYNVSYKFFHNDGTFRRDVYSDAARTLYIVLDDSSGELKITELKYYT